MKKKHSVFIFGYGSLINSFSRNVTGKTGTYYPALLKGIKREFAIDVDFGFTSVGTSLEKDKTVNGVLVQISSEEIEKFSKRESNYKLYKIDKSNLKLFSNVVIKEDCFLYLTKEEVKKPTSEFPILQSYIDVVMSGCIEIDKKLRNSDFDFTRGFIRSTSNWDCPWINDRRNPVYKKGEKLSEDLFGQIDEILEEENPDTFQKRVLKTKSL